MFVQLKPLQTRIALTLAETSKSGGHRLDQIAAAVGRPRSTVYAALRCLCRRRVAEFHQGGYGLSDGVLVSCKGQVYRQLWLLPDEEDPAA